MGTRTADPHEARVLVAVSFAGHTEGQGGPGPRSSSDLTPALPRGAMAERGLDSITVATHVKRGEAGRPRAVTTARAHAEAGASSPSARQPHLSSTRVARAAFCPTPPWGPGVITGGPVSPCLDAAHLGHTESFLKPYL